LPRLDRRAALLGGALVVLLALPTVAGFVGPAWELSQWAGLAAAIACILLCGAPLRPRDSQPPTLLSLRLHTTIGYAALILAALHIGGLVLSDHTVIEYLKPTAPLYQFAGIAAALLLAVLVLLSHGSCRRRLWKSHRGFQASHVVLACVLAALVAVHVVVTARYLGGIGRRTLYVAATIGALLMLLRARRPLQTSRQAPPRPIRVFGRHSALIVGVVAICAAALVALLPASVDASLREPPFRRASRLALDFPHDKHGAVNCLTCHHNYADGTGAALCVECHRSERADLRAGAEARFHGFCLDCHRHPSAALGEHKHGPVSGCHVCHRPLGSSLRADSGPRRDVLAGANDASGR
jgi:DMSO/TMAO reductase YedYZ heme-binding membrane subunit